MNPIQFTKRDRDLAARHCLVAAFYALGYMRNIEGEFDVIVDPFAFIRDREPYDTDLAYIPELSMLYDLRLAGLMTDEVIDRLDSGHTTARQLALLMENIRVCLQISPYPILAGWSKLDKGDGILLRDVIVVAVTEAAIQIHRDILDVAVIGNVVADTRDIEDVLENITDPLVCPRRYSGLFTGKRYSAWEGHNITTPMYPKYGIETIRISDIYCHTYRQEDYPEFTVNPRIDYSKVSGVDTTLLDNGKIYDYSESDFDSCLGVDRKPGGLLKPTFDLGVTIGSKGARLGFYANVSDMLRNKITVMHTGRALKKLFPTWPDERVADTVVAIKSMYDNYNDIEAYIATSREDCAWVYRNGPNSCMSGNVLDGDAHPAEVYASDEGSDFAVAYLKDESTGKPTARGIVIPEDKVYFTDTMYGNRKRLGPALRRMGYTEGTVDDCAGKKLNKIEYGDTYIMPYLDLPCGWVSDYGDYFVVTDSGDHCADSTSGLLHGSCFCEHCEEHHSLDEYEVREDNGYEYWCYDCVDDSANWFDEQGEHVAESICYASDLNYALIHPDRITHVEAGDGRTYTVDEDDVEAVYEQYGYPEDEEEYA